MPARGPDLKHRGDGLLLRVEVAVEGAQRDAGSIRDLRGGDLRDAVVGEQRGGIMTDSIQDPPGVARAS